MAQKVAGLTTTAKPRQILKRTAKWLSAAYEADKWQIIDTIGEGDGEAIDFCVRLPNGRLLTEEHELYATVKEFVFWIREGGYTNIYDAQRHKQYALAAIQLAWGLIARGYSSFAKLTSDQVDEICVASAAGHDGITSASVLVRGLLEQFQSWADVPAIFAQNKVFDLANISHALHIPNRWHKKASEQEVAYASARLNGKTLPRSGTKTVTVQNVQIVTTVFEALFALRHYMAALSLSFNPFPESASGRANALGATTEPTPIAPVELVLRFLSESANYIQRNAAGATSRYRAAWLSRDTEAWNPEKARAAKSQIKLISAAAFVLIAGFTARRLKEILKLKRSCLKGSDAQGWWLNVYIEKSERKWTWIPIPRIVARAVETLRSFDVDDPDEDQRLFTLNDPATGKRIKLDPAIQSIARTLGAAKYSDKHGQVLEWKWTPRQFRRFFAVMYIYRWQGKKETLAHHLRQYDLETANDYLHLDPEAAMIWLKEITAYKVFVAERVAANDDEFVGAMGDRFRKFVKRVQRKLDETVMVVSEQRAAIILRLMAKQHIVLTVKPWATCCCPHTEQGCERAACRQAAGFEKGDVGPDFRAAAPSVCPSCPWALISQGNVSYIESEIEELTETATQATGVFAELASEKVVVLSRYRDSLKR
ncbi:site-specific integrase [Rhizobium oryziradicis]|uniref:Integrase n=1 Tax=Rhizobium oryziradicis TaxID=1867956 RepID=A0A1Q8ZR65_9HYPH|nr:site-specific integrase [Rhizobium oryziradicis]OLP44546.1 hypothetical protein BJF95_08525 [Rhizobium oryziradicis]